MSDEEKHTFVPGPINLAEEAAKPKVKRTTTRKKKEPVSISAPVETVEAAPVAEPTAVKPKPAIRKKRKVKEDQDESVSKDASVDKTDASPAPAAPSDAVSETPSKPKAPIQKRLLFSTDDEEEEKPRPEPEAEKPAAGGDSEGDGPEKQEEGNRGEPRFIKKGANQRGNFKGKPNKPQHQQHQNHQQLQQNQLSNRKKKQQQWKEKQKQKKGIVVKKDRFKIDGLNAEFDNALDLGHLSEWEVLQNHDTLKAYLAEQPELKAETVFQFNEIYTLPLDQLREAAHASGEEVPSAPNRKQLIEILLTHAHKEQKPIVLNGVLEILGDGHGMLSYSSDSYRLRALSAYVPSFFIRKLGLQRGHELKCRVLPPMEEASCPLVVEIHEVQGMEPEKANEIVPFTEQIPYYPTKRIFLENEKQEDSNKVSMRVVDLISPIGFGQRGLIVAPPRTGKTILLQGMANSIQYNYPEAHLIILLIDERPEEVTDFRRRVTGGEVISSTFDENAESHVHAAEMVIEKSRRMVEAGKDVVILLDSITRLARAYNTVMPNSGKILSGGVEANALQKPKRFFGSARNIEGGGSLTIIATALVETGSKMDEVIFEEFKGTGNMELHLDRTLVDKRVFPALSMEKSGTRKEELLYHPDELIKIYGLRRAMKGVPSTEAMEMLISKVKKTGSNAEFLMTAAR